MPPPPPPMNSESAPRPVANTPRNALLESIEKGITLKVNKLLYSANPHRHSSHDIRISQKVDQSQIAADNASNNGGDDSRNDLLKSIRQGVELRPAAERELGAQRESESGGTTDALAEALRRALLERGRRLRSSDEESESSDNDGEWDD